MIRRAIAIAAACVLPALALAQEVPPPPPPELLPPAGVAVVRPPPMLELSVGGGVVDFADEGSSRLTKVGAAWDTRIMVGASSTVAGEVAYVGTANGVNNLMAPYASGGTILGSSIEGDIRVQPPALYGPGGWRRADDSGVRPFAFGGVGWNSYNLVNDQFRVPAAIHRSDDTLLLPIGAGVEGGLKHGLTVDARFTYRAMFEEQMLHVDGAGVAGGPTQGMSQWLWSARLGYIF